MTRTLLATTAVGLALGIAAPRTAEAAFTATMQQIGSGVVVNGTGTINTAALTPVFAVTVTNTPSQVNPQFGNVEFGSSGTVAIHVYVGLSQPGSFGTGGSAFASIRSGDTVAAAGSLLWLPTAYASGDELTSSMTFQNTSLADLGATVGSYVWSWGSRTNNTFDTFTLNIIDPNPPTPVPAPPALALFGVGLVGLAAARRRRG